MKTTLTALLNDILDETPSFDPSLDVSREQVGLALNELIARIRTLIECDDGTGTVC